MAPIATGFPAPPPRRRPRIVLYQQTHHHLEEAISLLPLLTGQQPPALTHLILAAIHINPYPSPLTLNEHPPDHPRFTQLWDEVLALQDSGINVMCMLGGAAQGSFARLDYQPSELASLPPLSELVGGGGGMIRLPAPAFFEQHYAPLRDFIRDHNLDGVDLDVEEPISLHGMIQLIDRLRADFGVFAPGSASSTGFTITLAPVATALIRGMKHLSGFDYRELERLRGASVDWYNVQFYNGWGGLEEDDGWALPNREHRGLGWGWYDEIVGKEGWRPERVVAGFLTNPRHGGSGYVGWEVMARRLGGLMERYPGFGGVMGWEYWEALPELEGVDASTGVGKGKEGKSEKERRRHEGGEEEKEEGRHYWRWAWRMRWILAMKEVKDRAVVVAAGRSLAGLTLPTQRSGF